MAYQSRFRFLCTVLGRAQDGGIPHFGCTRGCCKGKIEYPACIGIYDSVNNKRVLIEATPDIANQVALFDDLTERKRGERVFDAILITHAHIGHYAGLLHLGKEAGSTKSIPTYVSARMSSFIESNSPWSQLVIDNNIELKHVESKTPFEPIEGLTVEPITVKHREDFSDTFAFRITGEEKTVLFAPDLDSLEGIEPLLDGVDVAYLDGTFYDEDELPNRNISQVPHPLIKRSMKTLESFAAEHPDVIRFIHFNHSNPALHDKQIQEAIKHAGFGITKHQECVAL